ncbi:YesL family protein [Fredinandcohnia quinoae]|uniref:YesL family protein n=1 Tax=Fredinandcohnia quinoae TaxID=2918902 RepID=A0AAW5DX44_9BACI|nr:YesL family protein [Fredinandcohnia sp. SECRCQ15]MCH1625216.1 YesL family protein [Fredinandcohnia sp. SECRCQ15]
MGKMLQEASEWIVRLVWTNLLWFGFMIAGLGVFGFMPATVALFAVTRKWKLKDFDASILKTFKETYRKEFLRSNLIGLIFALIGFLLYVDLKIAEGMQGTFSIVLYVFIGFIILLYVNTIVHFFPIYVHYQYSMKEYIKQSFIISLISPTSSLLIVIGLFFIGYLIMNMPGLIPFVIGVLPAYWIMNVSLKRFLALEKQHAIVHTEMQMEESIR